jgi:hypothetical protein
VTSPSPVDAGKNIAGGKTYAPPHLTGSHWWVKNSTLAFVVSEQLCWHITCMTVQLVVIEQCYVNTSLVGLCNLWSLNSVMLTHHFYDCSLWSLNSVMLTRRFYDFATCGHWTVVCWHITFMTAACGHWTVLCWHVAFMTLQLVVIEQCCADTSLDDCVVYGEWTDCCVTCGKGTVARYSSVL